MGQTNNTFGYKGNSAGPVNTRLPHRAAGKEPELGPSGYDSATLYHPKKTKTSLNLPLRLNDSASRGGPTVRRVLKGRLRSKR